jgi:tetratricopeptide (TPR) repeat protein
MNVGLAEAWCTSVSDLDERTGDWQQAAANRATMLAKQGRHAECEMQSRALMAVHERMRREGIERAHARNRIQTAQCLGSALRNQGKYAEAETVYVEVLANERVELGAEHPFLLLIMVALGTTLSMDGKHDAALAQLREARAIQQRVLGADHIDTMSTTANIGVTLRLQRKYPEAEAMFRGLLKVQHRVLGPEHPKTLITDYNLRATLVDQGKDAEAAAGCREVLAIRRRVLGVEHPMTIATAELIARLAIAGNKK